MKTAKLNCVFMEKNNGNPVWRLRIRKKNLSVSMNFPFTERGRKLAEEIYKNKINQLNDIHTS
jgi:hypothetical protein